MSSDKKYTKGSDPFSRWQMMIKNYLISLDHHQGHKSSYYIIIYLWNHLRVWTNVRGQNIYKIFCIALILFRISIQGPSRYAEQTLFLIFYTCNVSYWARGWCLLVFTSSYSFRELYSNRPRTPSPDVLPSWNLLLSSSTCLSIFSASNWSGSTARFMKPSCGTLPMPVKLRYSNYIIVMGFYL